MMTYPDKIRSRLAQLVHCGDLPDASAQGIGTNLTCGSSVRFFLSIRDDGRIADAAFRSNGCGHSRAAADILAAWILNKDLVDLHGLADGELYELIQSEIGEISDDRRSCVAASIAALRSAFADHRLQKIGEFRGDTALICTCFGVTEQRIEDLVTTAHLTSVEEVTASCNAGSGCGSCRLLIQEILDSVL